MGSARGITAGVVLALALVTCGALDEETVADIRDATGIDLTDPSAGLTAAATGGTQGNSEEEPALDATRALRRVTHEQRGDKFMARLGTEGTAAAAAAANEFGEALRWVTPGDRAKELELQKKNAEANWQIGYRLALGRDPSVPLTTPHRNAFLVSARSWGRAADLTADPVEKADLLRSRIVALNSAGATSQACATMRDYLALRPGEPEAEAWQRRSCP